MHVTAFQCIERPNTNLLDCISDTVSSWIQAFHQALHISAFLGSKSEFSIRGSMTLEILALRQRCVAAAPTANRVMT